MPTIAYHTLGCKVNQYDTQAMEELLSAEGFRTVPFPGPADIFLIDAVTGLGLNGREVPIIKGDATSYAIAAASIVAKVTRDRQMVELDRLYPEYGFARNKGYGTKEHIEALKRIGPCPVHRRSFIGHFV